MTTTPFTLAGSLKYPPNGGEAVADRPFSVQSSFTSKAEYAYKFSGSGTKSVNFGTIDTTGVKALLIEVEPDSSPSAMPIMVTVNGGTEPIEISPGGFMCMASPNPTSSGVLALDIAWTTAASVKIWLLG